METWAVILLILLGMGINLLIAYFIIRYATDTEQQTHYMRTLIRFKVLEMQEKGVSDKDIEEMLFAHPNLPIVQKKKEEYV